MEIAGDAIAEAVLAQFAQLPRKRKPQTRGDGVREWVPLSGIVAQDAKELKCVSLGTGMKCLPRTKVTQAQGVVLHDWHAEIVAIRSFNRFLLDEIQASIASDSYTSRYLRRRAPSELTKEHFQPFAVNEGIIFHMYCSEAPCGDASMELIMAAQDDATPWDIPGEDSETSVVENALSGRGYFSQLGVVRRKPSRPDAPTTLSKSCTDKISLHQCTSLLSSITSLLILPERCYLQTLTLPESQYSNSGCVRAFGEHGRLQALDGRQWAGSYAFLPFSIRVTATEFEYSRRGTSDNSAVNLVPSNIAAAWTPRAAETLVGGVLQGRKQSDIKGASMISRRSLWYLAREITAVAPELQNVDAVLRETSYSLLKDSVLLAGRRAVKKHVRDTLQGWPRNLGDEFSLP